MKIGLTIGLKILGKEIFSFVEITKIPIFDTIPDVLCPTALRPEGHAKSKSVYDIIPYIENRQFFYPVGIIDNECLRSAVSFWTTKLTV